MTNTLYLYHQIACSLCKVDLKTNIVEISIEMIWKNLFVRRNTSKESYVSIFECHENK